MISPTAIPEAPFEVERKEILDHINNNSIRNVFFVSGDLHSGGAIDFGQQFSGQPPGRPEINVPHTNINGPTPAERYDTGCPQLGTWKIMQGGSVPNNYVSGASTAGAQCESLPLGGPGYVLIRVNNQSSPKQITLEVRDANNNVRINSANGTVLSLTRSLQ